MKLQAAFKLSAVALALASTSVAFAATINENSVESPNLWNGAGVFNPTVQDKSAYQFADFGSGLTAEVITSGNEQSRPVIVEHHKIAGDNTDYYKIDGSLYVKDLIDPTKLVPTKAITVDQLNQDTFQRGGTSNNFIANSSKQDQETKRIDSNSVTYGSTTVETTGKVSADLAVTNSSASNVDTFNIDVAGEVKTPNSDKVVLGVVDKHGDKYGVYAQKEENGKVVAETILTSSGISTTGSIKINGVDVATSLTANNTLATEAKELATTANATADAANTTAQAAQTTANVANTTAQAAQTTANEANTTAQAAQTTANEANTTATAAQTTANAADTKATNALTAVQDVNSKFAQVGSRVDQLNTKINDVEKTANRGTAIALAAQQNVPNIKPGQYAVFGGVGHYESESAFAMGVVGAINERTSISGAIGVAGGSEVGGRVGVAYVFGGK